MNTKILRLSLLSLVVTMILFGSGCKKFRDNREALTTIDNAAAETAYMDIVQTVLRVIDEHNASLTTKTSATTDPCFVVQLDTVGSFPKTVVIDYGDTCTGLFGGVRGGTLTLVFTGRTDAAGTLVTVTPNGFNYDEFNVEGTVKVSLQSNSSYMVTVTDGIVSFNPDPVSFASTWTVKLYQLNQPSFFDNVYSIDGEATGTNREGRDFDVTITKTLYKEYLCNWMRSGELEISIDELKDRKVVYGKEENCTVSGTCCDNVADVTIGSRREIEADLR